MNIIIKDSETAFAEFLAVIAKEPDLWMGVHVNMAFVNEQTLDSDGLSTQSLEKIQSVCDKVAKKICDSGLKKLEGKIFLFDDGDVAALFLCTPPASDEIVDKLRNEFAAQGLKRFFQSYSMKDKLATLVTLSQQKIKSAEDYKLKRRAVKVIENISDTGEPDSHLTKFIQKKRREHTRGVVLVIEDDLIARGMIASALQKGYTVLQAKDAKSGISAYIENAPNMVLLDIHLPDHDGHQVLSRLMLLDPEAYVVMVSADSVVNNVLLSKSSGSAGFVKKPFSKEKIMGYIQKCPTLGWRQAAV